MGLRSVAFILVAAVPLAAAVITGDLGPAAAQSSGAAVRLAPDDTAMVARGKKVYQEHCASCHGARLEGQANWRRRLPSGRLPAPPHDASGHTWHHSDALLFRITKHGPARLAGGGYQSDMVGYSEILSDDDIVAVLSFIKSTWPDEIRDAHDGINARSR